MVYTMNLYQRQEAGRSQREKRPLQKAATTKSLMDGLCPRWRGTGPDVLNDLPTAVWLALENDYVAAFGGDLGAGGEGFLEVAAVVRQIAGCFDVLAWRMRSLLKVAIMVWKSVRRAAEPVMRSPVGWRNTASGA